MNTEDFLHLSHCDLYAYYLFFLLSHILFCHWISQQQSPWLFILPLFCPYPILNQTTWLSEQENLNTELYLKQRLCWCPCRIIETWYCQITAACIVSSRKTERGNESGCSSDLQEDEMTSLQIWFSGLTEPNNFLIWSSSGQEEIQSIYLLDFYVAGCTIHSASVSVAMVTLSTVYFLMLTHNSVPSTRGNCNLKYLRSTGVILRNLTSSASITMPMVGPTP